MEESIKTNGDKVAKVTPESENHTERQRGSLFLITREERLPGGDILV